MAGAAGSFATSSISSYKNFIKAKLK